MSYRLSVILLDKYSQYLYNLNSSDTYIIDTFMARDSKSAELSLHLSHSWCRWEEFGRAEVYRLLGLEMSPCSDRVRSDFWSSIDKTFYFTWDKNMEGLNETLTPVQHTANKMQLTCLKWIINNSVLNIVHSCFPNMDLTNMLAKTSLVVRW